MRTKPNREGVDCSKREAVRVVFCWLQRVHFLVASGTILLDPRRGMRAHFLTSFMEVYCPAYTWRIVWDAETTDQMRPKDTRPGSFGFCHLDVAASCSQLESIATIQAVASRVLYESRQDFRFIEYCKCHGRPSLFGELRSARRCP